MTISKVTGIKINGIRFILIAFSCGRDGAKGGVSGLRENLVCERAGRKVKNLSSLFVRLDFTILGESHFVSQNMERSFDFKSTVTIAQPYVFASENKIQSVVVGIGLNFFPKKRGACDDFCFLLWSKVKLFLDLDHRGYC